MAESLPLDWGSRLRRERERRKWSRKHLAEKIGTGASSVFRWEEAGDRPRTEMLQALIDLLGKPVDAWGNSTWMVPYLRNAYFTGRESLLKRLHTVLSRHEVAAVSQTRAISGLGGIGKTQTAVEYAYRYGQEYDLVLWVLADSRTTLVAQLAGLAAHFGLAHQTEVDQYRLAHAVKQHLETQEGQVWLLILDNVEELQVVQEFLPTRGNGAVLLTTRLYDVGTAIRKLDLDTLTREEGVQFLQARLAAVAEPEQHPFTEAERQASEELWTLLGGLPLALDQAAAFVQETSYSLTEYLALFQQAEGALLRRRGLQATDHLDSVAVTFELAWKQVHQASPAAAELLRLCAFLAPDAIPEELFTERPESLPSSLREALAQPLGWQEVLGTLRRYSLLGRQAETKTLSLHRLVQAVLREDLDQETRRDFAEQVVHLVNAAFPHPEPETWPQCERLLPQALQARQWIEQYQVEREEAGRLLFELGAYLQYLGRPVELEPMYQRAIHIFEHLFGPEHLQVAHPLHLLGTVYRHYGKYAEAEQFGQRALSIYERQLGPTHPDVASALNTLAIYYDEQGRYAEAEPLFLRALSIWEQQGGPRDDRTATALLNLGELYGHQGQYAKAEPFYHRALDIWEQLFGPEHSRVAYPLSGLGALSQYQGKDAEAEQLLLRALHIWEQVGPDYPELDEPLIRLATLYRDQGKDAEAEPLYRRALANRERQGPAHPLVAAALTGLATLSCRQGRDTEAEPLYLRALRIWEQQGDHPHPERAETMEGLARLREAQGHHEEARNWYERALAIRAQALGAQHPKTKETRQRLIALLHALGQHEEAARLEVTQTEQRGESRGGV